MGTHGTDRVIVVVTTTSDNVSFDSSGSMTTTHLNKLLTVLHRLGKQRLALLRGKCVGFGRIAKVAAAQR